MTVRQAAKGSQATQAEEEARALARRIEADNPGWKVEVCLIGGHWLLDGESADGTEGFLSPVSLLQSEHQLRFALDGPSWVPGVGR